MAGFSKMLEQASMGALWIATRAPDDRPFDMNLFNDSNIIKPAPEAFQWLLEKELLKEVGPAVYRITPHGMFFRNYVNGDLKEREAVQPEPLYA
jgi:hypothetical protein